MIYLKGDFMNKRNTLKSLTIILLMLSIIIFVYIIFYDYNDIYKIELNDHNNNNYLDILELNIEDSKSFYLWFSNIIINVVNNDMKIPDSYSDCAGLIRYAYKESLKKHDQTWIKETGYKGNIFKDIKKYNYPEIPFIGTDIFYLGEDIFVKKNYSNFASARYLVEFNMDYLGSNIVNIKTGDILAFFHPYDIEYPYHLMVYIEQNRERYVIYHTGPISENNPGELRLTNFEDLKYADPSWIANKENKNFLGFYRFKILSDNYE
ncbi:DUF1175 family protein [Geotoga petraea]|jgi:hypothetical protein|uniref:DUF1175 family protein n=2 Tax=Geotoga petraea TaxID=28234 RepID=A0A4Z0W5P9_9BACT|nr:uncharacterized protein [Geotoga sp.]TGG88377.1 DUF1175 family protein [Geotoga petraea]